MYDENEESQLSSDLFSCQIQWNAHIKHDHTITTLAEDCQLINISEYTWSSWKFVSYIK